MMVTRAARPVGGGVPEAWLDGRSARMIVIEHGADFALPLHPTAEGTNTIILVQQVAEPPATLHNRVYGHCTSLNSSDVCLTRASMVLRHGQRDAWGHRLKLAKELLSFLALARYPELNFVMRGEILKSSRNELFAMIGVLMPRCDRSLAIRAHFEMVHATRAFSGLRPAAASAVRDVGPSIDAVCARNTALETERAEQVQPLKTQSPPRPGPR